MCAQTSVVVQLQIASLVYGVEAGIRVGDAVKSISARDVHRPLGSLWTASVYSVGVPTDSRWPLIRWIRVELVPASAVAASSQAHLEAHPLPR